MCVITVLSSRVWRYGRRCLVIQQQWISSPCRFLVLCHCGACFHIFKGPNRRVQRVRLFLFLFVLYMPWIPGEHRRGICAVECVTAHLRGFEEVSRSEVVIWIDEWSIEFGYHWLMSLVFLTAHLFQFRFVDSEHGYFYFRLYCTCLGFQANIVEEYHALQNDYSFDALQTNCFGINIKL